MERLGLDTSVIGMGCWQIGGSWGEVPESDALATLHAAADAGVTFFDTADVYGNGRSEQLVGRFRRERPAGSVFVATKMGRRADPHVAGAYTLDNFRAWNDRSRANLGMDTLDLVQLHCPPSPVFTTQATYDAKGETFSGVPYDVGIAAAQEFAGLVPEGVTPAQFALRWIVDTPGVSVVIPGARNAEQARANAAAGSLPPLSASQRDAVAALYDRRIREHVHASW